VECEPYLTADHALMMERTEEVAYAGIQVLMKGLGVEKAIVGIENNKPDAIKKMKEVAAGQCGSGAGAESEISPGG
jgi:electron transport complex protein RnfC